MKITILSPGKTKKPYLRAGIDDFVQRLSHSVKLNYQEVKVKGMGGKLVDPHKEGVALLGRIPDCCYLVCLDSGGTMFSSPQFSTFVQDKEQQAVQQLCFLIGGPVGFSDDVLNRADLRISFSPMTFTHDMARFLLLEQLYRAYAIKQGTGYHK